MGQAGLRTCAGTAGDTGARAWRGGLTGQRCDLLVGAVARVRMGGMFMADHHPAESKKELVNFHSAPSTRLWAAQASSSRAKAQPGLGEGFPSLGPR